MQCAKLVTVGSIVRLSVRISLQPMITIAIVCFSSYSFSDMRRIRNGNSMFGARSMRMLNALKCHSQHGSGKRLQIQKVQL